MRWGVARGREGGQLGGGALLARAVWDNEQGEDDGPGLCAARAL